MQGAKNMKALGLATALALGWTQCSEAFAQATFYEAVFWEMQAVPTTAEQGAQTGAIGQLLFTQNFASSGEAVLPSGASIPIPAPSIFSRSPGNADFEPGATLSRVTAGGVTLYCDRRVTFRARDGRRQRLCLLDSNQDSVFDVVYWGAAPSNAEMFNTFTAFRPDRSEASVRYAMTEQTTPLLSGGVAVTRSALNAYRLEFGVATAGNPIILQNAADRDGDRRVEGQGPFSGAVYFRGSDIPLTLRVAGAEVEITSIVGDTVTYRINSTFDSTRPVAFAFAYDFPLIGGQ